MTEITGVENKTIFQSFEWYSLADHQHWSRLKNLIPTLKSIGIDNIWLPPGCKASTPQSNGYDIYDLYDLGEFDQKGSQSTKWGNKSELLDLIQTAQQHKIGIYWDAVLNHKAAGDGTERCQAIKVNPKDRRKEIGKSQEVEVWTKFDFNGRNNKYSKMKYHWKNFSGIDYDQKSHTKAIYKFIGEEKSGWAKDVDKELGNYDYLMFADVDYSNRDVCTDVIEWGHWITEELGLSGMRLDAMKHYSEKFQLDFVKTIQNKFGKDFFIVGEYWKSDSEFLSRKIQKFQHSISLFDVQLVYNFSEFSKGKQIDLRCIFDGSLVQIHPKNTVTFVANHDTQECQSLEAPIEEWFIPHAYSLILLHDGGYPCVFWGDYQGNLGPRPRQPSCEGKLARLILARKLYAYGKQRDYFDLPNCIGWTRFGHQSQSDGAGLAVLLTNSWTSKRKRMFVGQKHAREIWTNLMSWNKEEVIIDGRGFGIFPVGPRGISVWTVFNASGLEKINVIGFEQRDNTRSN